MDPVVVEIRREVCATSCDRQCDAYLRGKVRHDDPEASCPRRGWALAWGCYGPCDGPTPKTEGQNATRTKPPRQWLTKARRLASGLRRWAKAGFPITERAARAARKAACEGCALWNPEGNAGLGECRHPSCGCSKLKRWLATERCPLNKWPAPALTGLFPRLATTLKRIVHRRPPNPAKYAGL